MGIGAGVGGAISGISTAYAAYTAQKEAEAARKQQKEMWNKDTGLKIAQFNMNQNRLAGLAAITGGKTARYRGQIDPTLDRDSQEYYDALDAARERARTETQGTGDYSTLTASDYQIGGGSASPAYTNPMTGIETPAVLAANDFSGGGTSRAPSVYAAENDLPGSVNTIGIARDAVGSNFTDYLMKESTGRDAGSRTGLTETTLTSGGGLGGPINTPSASADNAEMTATSDARKKAALLASQRARAAKQNNTATQEQ